ncbi:MAG: tetratricopeptide repeat protein [Deltaproteobacteria bacterium]|nr:tetratricopeptide repeat protein [Deltaproteobacteria bacterium]
MYSISKYLSLIIILFLTGCDNARREYFPDGKLKSRREVSSATGELNGESAEYSENGSLLTISSYRNNKLDGKRCSYYENGDLKLVEIFKQADRKANTKELSNIERVTKYYPTKSTNSFSSLIPAWVDRKLKCTSFEESQQEEESTTEYSNGKPTKATAYDASGKITQAFVFSKWGEPLSTEVVKRFELVKSLLSSQKLNEALNELNAIVLTIPNSSTAYMLRARLFDQQKQFKNAIEDYQRAVALNPQNAEAYFGLGQALSRDGNVTAALSATEEAARLEPSTKYFTYLALLQRRLENFDDALASFQHAAALDPQNDFLLSQMGDIFRELHKNDLAFEAYQKALTLDPSSGPRLVEFARFLLKTGKEDEAVLNLKKAIDLLKVPTKGSANTIAMLALLDAYWGLGDIDSYYQLITKDDTDERASITLSAFYDEIGERSLAISRLQDKTFDSFNSKTEHYNLGEALYLSGQKDEALKELNSALEVDPRDENASALLGKALLDVGRLPEAKSALESALKIQPKCALAHQQLFKLNQIRTFSSTTKIDSPPYIDAIQTLVKNSIGPDVYARRRSMWQLGLVALDDVYVGDFLSNGLHDRNNFVRINALWKLSNTRVVAKKHSANVAIMLNDKDPWIVRQATRTLVEISNLKELSADTKSKMISRMIEDLHNADPLIRRHACIILGKLGVYAKEALPDLRGLTTDTQMQINEKSTEAIALITAT